MRKLLHCLLALCLLLPLCAQAADDPVAVTDQILWTYQTPGSMKSVAYVPFELTNTSNETVALTVCQVEVLDQAGNLLLREETLNFFPKVLAPGQKGYGVYECGLWGTNAAQFAAPRIHPVALATDKEARVLPLRLDFNEIDDCCGVIRACFTAKNNTDRPMTDGVGVAALFGEDGRLLDVAIQPYADNLFPETPIVLSPGEVDGDLVLRLWSYNFDVFTAMLEHGVEETIGFICSAQADLRYYGDELVPEEWW